MGAERNRLGLTRQDYVGSRSTLCPGCGHEGITAQIIQAAWELGLEAHRVAKLSGIGCSSKTPAYFMSGAWGFNSVHGRAAAVATGVALANRDLINLLISGDGDSVSIGLTHFAHLIRRNVPVVYIIENNGVYGLTKGQFSATADLGTRHRGGEVNELQPIDPCTLAMELGCSFVARGFSGHPAQLLTLIKAAFAHSGTALIDVISPCVSFNSHEGSSRSFRSVKEHEVPLQDLCYVSAAETEQNPTAGGTQEIAFPDGSRLTLRALRDDFDVTDRFKAMERIHRARERGEILTGLLHLSPSQPVLQEHHRLAETPLAHLPEVCLKPGPERLKELLDELV
ncbi:MAG TPA: 2-oxoacid:ferredoxin oxidoreductase subunit beta [Holophaga sp.]|nr:2-oxoacid:ferredoxin oxidoreductase subunit beta [Holophaga sp.]